MGFVERGPDAVVVAAGVEGRGVGPEPARRPACRVTIGDESWAAVATQLEGPEHAAAVRDLILRYGTPAETLGAGPAFELRRVAR